MVHGHRSLPWQLVVILESVVQEAHQCVLRWLFRRWQDTMVLTAERCNSFCLVSCSLCAGVEQCGEHGQRLFSSCA